MEIRPAKRGGDLVHHLPDEIEGLLRRGAQIPAALGHFREVPVSRFAQRHLHVSQQLDRRDHVDVVLSGVGHELADFLESEPVVFPAQLGIKRVDEMVRLDEPQLRVDLEERE